jgi:hypothetical protein
MHFDVTSLVNNVILPSCESTDIIGLEYLQEVTLWLYIPDCEARNLAIGYVAGSILSIILIESQVFIGMNTVIRKGLNVNRITERIESHEGFEKPALGFPT